MYSYGVLITVDYEYRNHPHIVPEKSIIEKITTDPYILPVQNVDKYGGGPGILYNLNYCTM